VQPPTQPTILPLIAAFQLAAATATVYNGRAGQINVAPPRIEADVTIDGRLDEPQWRQAALLTGFSLYQPADQRPAPDSTEVFVWYSSNAMYFGIRAYEPHGTVTATLADRDRISSDDNVEIHLDTFDERNRAIVFVVNPLGIQADGTKSEIGGFIPGSNVMPGQNDLSADYLWQSRGHVTDYGFEVEIRIPFSSLRYRNANVQQWGLQIDRRVQHSGYEETWTPAKRASATFIGQSGRLTGLTGMRHGTVVELNPELTNTVTGGPCCATQQRDWRYKSDPTLGGNVRWTLGSNFVLNGTVKPDFSQVEADATQIAADERFALFYAEKRPFFVEALDQFNVPNTLVYTRTIVRPDAAVKLTGKVGRADVAVLSALDEQTNSAGRPLVDILRVRQGFGEQSSGALMYSDRVTDGRSNRVFGGDTKIVFGKYYAQFQLNESMTSENGATRDGPLWEAVLDRTGRAFGFHYNVIGIDPDFRADNGFVPRVGYVQPSISNRLTLYGSPGALFERFNAFGTLAGLWRYHDFFSAKSVLEDRASAMMQVTLRGGWSISATPKIATYAFDPSAYPNFRPADRTESLVSTFSIATPQFRTFAASVGGTIGNDVDLLETSRVRRTDYNASLDVRPNSRLRLNATYVGTQFVRRSDGERSAFQRIPRVKIEYQLARPVFVRVVSQYTATNRDALRDPRTGEILLVTSGGSSVPSQASSSNVLRTDWLFSYRPAPGTVFFVGYGGSLTEPDPLAFQELRRQNDAFFVKLSYAFRMTVGD
jgi:hypothetical protein